MSPDPASISADLLERLARSEPVILLGRGGSGTRLLSELALPLGLFLGSDLNVSSDSMEWVDDIYALAVENLTEEIAAGSERDLAWRERLRRRAGAVLLRGRRTPEQLWGWKLPETMLILAQALRSFPKARVVHLVRHPLTSAWRRTHVTSRKNNPVGLQVLTAAYRQYGRDLAAMEQDGPHIHNAITWRYQIENVQNLLGAHDPARVLVMRYEDLCATPQQCQDRLRQFLGLPPGRSKLQPAIDEKRLGSEPPDEAVRAEIWQLCGGAAAALGYER